MGKIVNILPPFINKDARYMYSNLDEYSSRYITFIKIKENAYFVTYSPRENVYFGLLFLL